MEMIIQAGHMFLPLEQVTSGGTRPGYASPLTHLL